MSVRMLRSTRSLPSLKVLDSAFRNEVRTSTRAFGTVSTKYNLCVPDIPHHATRPFAEFKRSVHQTSKKNATTLLSTTKNSEFSLMSLNSLKMECRKRGLKVSGRKSELVSRIQTYDNSFAGSEGSSMSTAASETSKRPAGVIKKAVMTNPLSKMHFSKSSNVEAKGDDSHIDYIKPIDQDPDQLVGDDYIIQIPSISTKASQTPVTKLEKKLKEEGVDAKINDKVISKAAGSDSKIFEFGSFFNIDEQNDAAAKEQGFEGAQEKPEEKYKYDDSEIPSYDKKVWAGLLAGVGAWWLFKPKNKK